jgi:hypothetical protein
MPVNSRGQRVATNKKSKLNRQSAQAKALRAGSQSPMGKKKTSATGAVGGAG